MTSSKEDTLKVDIQPNDDAPVKKKRGRKPKQVTDEPISTENVVSIPKKRGRKPKGGKIITTPTANNENEISTPCRVQVMLLASFIIALAASLI